MEKIVGEPPTAIARVPRLFLKQPLIQYEYDLISFFLVEL
jgi:hypothetical protein